MTALLYVITSLLSISLGMLAPIRMHLPNKFITWYVPVILGTFGWGWVYTDVALALGQNYSPFAKDFAGLLAIPAVPSVWLGLAAGSTFLLYYLYPQEIAIGWQRFTTAQQLLLQTMLRQLQMLWGGKTYWQHVALGITITIAVAALPLIGTLYAGACIMFLTLWITGTIKAIDMRLQNNQNRL